MTGATLPSLPVISKPNANCTELDGATETGWSWPDASEWHLFGDDVTADGPSRDGCSDSSPLFVADGSRVFAVDADVARTLQRVPVDASRQAALLESLGIPRLNAVLDQPPSDMPIRALSLAVAQKCNLGCTYCYAEGGSFGGTAKNMPLDTALDAVDRLLADVEEGDKVNLAFLGGEPLVNRDVLRAATLAAKERGAAKGVHVGLSITTNGTLLNEDDAKFFERYGFAVTISLDGVGKTHDRLRPMKGGRGSYTSIIRQIAPLLELQENMQVSARVTVTPRNMELLQTLTTFINLGFHSVGFSPMLSSPTGRDEMGRGELDEMLQQMIGCGRLFERNVLAKKRFPFSNMANAMQEEFTKARIGRIRAAPAEVTLACRLKVTYSRATGLLMMLPRPWETLRMELPTRSNRAGLLIGMCTHKHRAGVVGRVIFAAVVAIMKS